MSMSNKEKNEEKNNAFDYIEDTGGIYMAEILVFRSAKHPVVKECIEKINNEYGDCIIWLCIQEQCMDMYSEYTNIQFITFPNGMFNYEKTIANKKLCRMLVGKAFDDIYIPYSSHVPNCEEIEKIVVHILKERKAIYYGRDGNTKKKCIYIIIKPKKILKTLYESINYCVMKMIYMYFERRGRDAGR